MVMMMEGIESMSTPTAASSRDRRRRHEQQEARLLSSLQGERGTDVSNVVAVAAEPQLQEQGQLQQRQPLLLLEAFSFGRIFYELRLHHFFDLRSSEIETRFPLLHRKQLQRCSAASCTAREAAAGSEAARLLAY